MASKAPSNLLTTIEQIEKYEVEPDNHKYRNFENRKSIMIRNVISKYAYDQIGILINPDYEVIHDGKNQDFCTTLEKKFDNRGEMKKWWFSFSSCKETGARGIKLEFVTIREYNRLKDALRWGYLQIRKQEWDGIKNTIAERVSISSVATQHLEFATMKNTSEIATPSSSFQINNSSNTDYNSVNCKPSTETLETCNLEEGKPAGPKSCIGESVEEGWSR
ncbi:hypothetical protein HOY80DRAFT_1067010 [Tuber brumale]|nr:hypothetical protein HOY80DRAFT_1067010 [Tuber brumale]